MLSMSPDLLRRISGWALAAYWCLLFVVTHIPLPKLPGPEGSDKVGHLGAYLALQFLLLLWLDLSGKLVRRTWPIAIVVIWGYAVVDEVLQSFVNRHCDFWDGVADCCGSVLGVIVFLSVRRWLPSTDSPS